jgi:hypothetical protein
MDRLNDPHSRMQRNHYEKGGVARENGRVDGRDQYPRTRQSENRVDIDLILNHDSSSHRILVMVRRKLQGRWASAGRLVELKL